MRRGLALAAAALLLVLAALRVWHAAPRPAAPGPAPTPPSASSARGWSAPDLDLPASRLHERVDGAEPLLRELGCQRLRVFRVGPPAADVEILDFATVDGAKQALSRDAGPDRAPEVPGDEGWVSTSVVFFRRGTSYVRLVADQAAPAGALIAQARKIDQAFPIP